MPKVFLWLIEIIYDWLEQVDLIRSRSSCISGIKLVPHFLRRSCVLNDLQRFITKSSKNYSPCNSKLLSIKVLSTRICNSRLVFCKNTMNSLAFYNSHDSEGPLGEVLIIVSVEVSFAKSITELLHYQRARNLKMMPEWFPELQRLNSCSYATMWEKRSVHLLSLTCLV